MNLLKICEPVFLEICSYNCYAADLQDYDLRSEFKSQLAKAEKSAERDPLMASLFEQVRKPLVYFADDYVVASPLFPADGVPHRSLTGWKKEDEQTGEPRFYALEDELFQTSAGGSEFYIALDEALRDARPDTAERLLVFETCLGLGFIGHDGNGNRSEPERIREYMTKIRKRLARLGQPGTEDSTTGICPEAYFHIKQPLTLKPTRWLRWVGVGFAILMLGVGAFYIIQFREGKKELTKVLNTINKP